MVTPSATEVLVLVVLSNNIPELRFRYGEMTQEELAELVAVSRQTMNAIKKSKHAPTIDVAIRIADVLRDSIDGVFEFEYEGKPEFLIVCVLFAGNRDQIGTG